MYYRFLAGRWRKSGLPLVCNVHPREDKQSYSTSAQVVHEECVRRSLPVLQLGSDHFVGIHDAVRPALRGARSVTSLWHMMRNILNNNRRRVWLLEELQSRRGQVQQQPSPKINNRPLGVVLSYLYTASMLPSKVMFHTYMQSMLRRIRNWGDGDWVDYSDNAYLYNEYSSKSGNNDSGQVALRTG